MSLSSWITTKMIGSSTSTKLPQHNASNGLMQVWCMCESDLWTATGGCLLILRHWEWDSELSCQSLLWISSTCPLIVTTTCCRPTGNTIVRTVNSCEKSLLMGRAGLTLMNGKARIKVMTGTDTIRVDDLNAALAWLKWVAGVDHD